MPEGWSIPVHRSLTKRLYWMGVPRNILILELAVVMLLGVMLKTFLVLVFVALLHVLLRYLGQLDPMFDWIFNRYVRLKTYYCG